MNKSKADILESSIRKQFNKGETEKADYKKKAINLALVGSMNENILCLFFCLVRLKELFRQRMKRKTCLLFFYKIS